MAGKTAVLSIRVVSDNKQARTGLSQVDDSVKGLETTMKRLGETVVLQRIGSELVGLANQAVDAASRAEQAAGAVQSVFGSLADEVEANAARAAEAVGLSASQYNELASVLGAQLRNLGTPVDELAGQTDNLIALGSDLAATFGGTTADAVSALSALFRGERDPIERYGVSIKQATVDAYLAANGLDDLEGSARTAAESQATMALLLEQTAAAQGQFNRETDTYAVSQQIANAKIDDAMATLGEVFLPIMSQGAQLLSEFAGFAAENAELVQILAIVIGGFTAAILLMNLAMLANPMTLIIAGIMVAISLLVAGIYWLAQNWDDVWSNISDTWNGFVGMINDGIDGIIGWIQDAIGWFQDLFNWGNSSGGLTAAINASATADGTTGDSWMLARAALTASPSASTIGPVSSSSNAAPAPVIVNISGVIDSASAAREIRKVLTDDTLRTGRRRPGQDVPW
ncbi:hypothetical protein AUC47_04885 [Microbacterium sp. SZ1]|uniref:hypothetical protein n=1 Tax=Microbacterium sp. SZ1 TaxID=1849736 RepID=UPI000BBC7725|nr:hypothetical protein [Microbacterium sp. SZ1]PCE13986.1 hypothetical protein AUC47_04885 [Microbacterium sp. SZ1]